MHKYQVVLCWSDMDEAYVAEAPELPGAWSTETRRRRRSPTSTMPYPFGSTLRGSSAIPFRSRKPSA